MAGQDEGTKQNDLHSVACKSQVITGMEILVHEPLPANGYGIALSKVCLFG